MNCAMCLKDQVTASSSVYHHISFSPCNKNLEKIMFVKSTSKQKIPKKEVRGLRQNWPLEEI